jgi:LysM repeat protein
MRSRNWGLTAGIALVVGAVLLGIVLIWRAGPETSDSVTPTPSQQTGATRSPSPIPSSTPPKLVTYTVKEGDTLSGIAQAYDISLEDLIGANDLANPDFLQIGQTLVIPQDGRADALAPASTAVPGEISPVEGYDDAELPTLTPSGPALIEISNVLSAGDLTVETIILENEGGTVSLEGWTLSTAVDDTFVFPPLTLFTGGTVQVHSATGEDAPRDLYWGRTEPAWEVGGLATLRDADGNIVDTYIIPES